MLSRISIFRTFPILFNVAILLALLVGSAKIVTPVYAAGITVNTTVDENNTGANCSLREAITAANTNLPYGGCTTGLGADIITLPAGTYTLTIGGIGEDANATGDLDITGSLTINGAGTTSIIQAGVTQGSAVDRVFDVLGAITVGINNVVIANGYGTSTGGGINNSGGTLSVTNVTFSNNFAAGGGGIYNSPAGTLSVTNSIFSGNSVNNSGGGIGNSGTLTVTGSTFNSNFSTGASSGDGGAIFTFNALVNVTNSTFYFNYATLQNGGGISTTLGTLNVTNSTFWSNSATKGGAIFDNGGVLNVVNSTIAVNSGGGLYLSVGAGTGPMTVKNSILELNTGGDCIKDGAVTFTADSFNMDDDGSCDSATQKTLSQINLGPLSNNGGTTLTFPLLSGSHAINAGNDAVCAATVGSPNFGAGGFDQRGVARPAVGCDIGSFEFVYKLFLPLILR